MIKITLALSFLFIFSITYTQYDKVENVNSGNDARIGFKIGTGETYPSANIGYHGIAGITFEKNLTEKWYLSADAEYFDKSFSYSQAYYDNRAFGDELLNKWQNFSINAAMITRVTEKGRIGFGVTAEYFIISKNKYDRNSSWSNYTRNMLRPGIFGSAGLDFKLNNYFTFFIDGRYKMVFMDEEYGMTKLNAVFSLMGYAGFKLDV